MQDAFGRDMFNVPNINCSRYNGHIQVSNSGARKRDRKGCTKGKIEAIMKNNTVRPTKVCVPVPLLKKQCSSGNSSGNSQQQHQKSGLHYGQLKVGGEQDDPYTFTEWEPQQSVGGHYQQAASLASSKKVPTVSMVCADKARVDPTRGLIKPPQPPLVPPQLNPTSKMNKLQADIARNKVIGKRRKIDHQVGNSVRHSSDWKRERSTTAGTASGSSGSASGRICIAAKFNARNSTWHKQCKSRHELLQRILEVQNEGQQYTRDLYPLGLELSDSDDEAENSIAIYGRHWFSRSGLPERGGEGTPRERRVEELRTELRRKLTQTLRGLANAELPSTHLLTAVIAAARRFPNATAAIIDPTTVRTTHKPNKGARFLVSGEKCSYPEGCNWQSLPCTRHCSQHIMYNVDQRLFSHCTAKYPDNTQCSAPVFDVLHDLPLCFKHSVSPYQGNNIKYGSDSKSSKKVSKKSRLLGGNSRSGKRSQKKKKKSNDSGGGHLSRLGDASDRLSSPRHLPLPTVDASLPNTQNHIHFEGQTKKLSLSAPHSRLKGLDDVLRPLDAPLRQVAPSPLVSPAANHNLMYNTLASEENHGHFEEIEVSEEVLEIASLDPASQEIANQASRLLEEHDITNMLNQISPDAFNDLFTDKNGEYEPTREETEELERALEAVDNDVRSLEQMTRSLPLLLDPIGSLLDDPNTAPSHAFHNGFPAPATVTDIHPS